MACLGAGVPARAQATPADASAAGAAPVQLAQQDNQPAAGDQTQKLESVVVTGIRQSLKKQLAEKQNAPNVIEYLSAEDIGKLPDASIAESLARLPGLSTNRDRGNSTQISIRGMGPELTNLLINGREMATAEPSRIIRYEQYPAELITGAYVYKSPTAAQAEGAIAGQVDLQTIKPLDYKESQVVLTARANYNDLAPDVYDAKAFGENGSFSYIGQFLDHTLGVAIGYAGRNEPVATVRTNIYRNTNSFQDLSGDGNNTNVPYGFEALVRGGTDTRHGALATVQWVPNRDFSLTSDLFYSRYTYQELQRGFTVNQLPFGNTFSNPTVVDDGATALTATRDQSYGLLLQDANSLFRFTDVLYAGGLNAAWKGYNWKATADVGYSTTARNQLFVQINTAAPGPGTNGQSSGPTVSYSTQAGSPATFTSDYNLTDPAQNPLYNLQIPTNGGGAPLINDHLFSAKSDFQYDTDWHGLDDVKVGVRYTDREKNYTERTQFSGYSNTALPAGLQLPNVVFPGQFSNVPSTLAFDVLGVADQVYGGIHPVEESFDQVASWRVYEKTYGGYLQGDFSGRFLSRDFNGNLGVRVVQTDEISDGFTSGNGATPVPVSYTNGFTKVLPTLNLTYLLSQGQQVRFAAGKAIARPPLDYLNPGYSVYTSGSGSTLSATAQGGNPNLRPYQADQLDLTYERYFTKDTAVTLSTFYKYLDTYIVQQSVATTIDVNGTPTAGTIQQPVNGNGGRIEGAELLFQQAFTFLPGAFNGLGVYFTASYTDSKVRVQQYDNTIGNTTLPGLSRYVGNATLWYSKYGIESRIAYRYRSSYVTQPGDTDRLLHVAPEGIVDFEANYAFPESGNLKGLKLMFQADNLTNQPYETYYAVPAQQGRYELFGRRYWLGASYKFAL